jgi:minor fimbrial subunit
MDYGIVELRRKQSNIGIGFILSLTLIAGYVTSSHAAEGFCDPNSGPTNLSYDYGNQTITNPDINQAGYVAPTKALTAPTGQATLTCNCTGGPYRYLWLYGDTPLAGKTTIGGLNYYDISGNDNLQVAIQVKTVVSGYQNIPFGPVHNSSNKARYQCGDSVLISTGGGSTGGAINVSLRIKKSFTGTSVIPSTLVGSTYWNIGDTGGSVHGGTATTNIYFSGEITVPQYCSVNAGSIVVVNLGNIYSRDMKIKGQKSTSYTAKSFSVPIQCNDLSATANVSLHIEGLAATDVPQALQTSNKDVGVVVGDSSEQPMVPNDSSTGVPFILDENYQAVIPLKVWPVNLTGSAPEEGTFSALAKLVVDFS